MGIAINRRAVFSVCVLLAACSFLWQNSDVFAADLVPPSDTRVVYIPPPVTMHVTTDDQVQAARTAIDQYLFGQPSLPTTLPSMDGNNIVVAMQNGLISRVRIHEPKYWNGAVVIYNHGHQGDVPNDALTISTLTGVGYRVYELDMPFYGANAVPITLTLPTWGTVTFHKNDHEQMRFLAPVTVGSPIRYFIEPVIAIVNMLDQEGVARIYMTGISGGGWTTVMAAALDTRIDASYPMAHSLPMAYRFPNTDDFGDYEQTDPGLYSIADYQDLYVMGAAGRRQLSMYNEHDNCCWYGDLAFHQSYAPQVQATAAALNGNWTLWVDPIQVDHAYGPGSIARMVSDMANEDDLLSDPPAS